MTSPNTSATGGYLAPLSTPTPTEDADFDAQLQAIVTGVVGLDGSLVRPRWQPIDPKQPDRSTNWCAIGIVNITPDSDAAIHHVSFADIDDPATHDEMQRHEMVEVMASFYGPSAYTNASLLRDGFAVAQNREAMFLEGMGFVETVNIVSMPELVNNLWIRRADITFRIRRIIVRTYPVQNIVSSDGTISSTGPSISTPFNVEESL